MAEGSLRRRSTVLAAVVEVVSIAKSIAIIVIAVGSKAVNLVQSLVAGSCVGIDVGNLKLELSDWMESKFVGGVTNSVPSSVGPGVRVASLHNECLAVVFQLSSLFDFNSVLRSKP